MSRAPGGAGGLGAQREKELNSAAKVLQIDDATVVDDPSLQDGHFGHWCPKHISAVVQDHCKHVCADTVSHPPFCRNLKAYSIAGFLSHGIFPVPGSYF